MELKCICINSCKIEILFFLNQIFGDIYIISCGKRTNLDTNDISNMQKGDKTISDDLNELTLCRIDFI